MHFLIALTIVAGLIAIGFGGGTARAFVRGIIYCAAAAVLAMVLFVAVEVWDALRPDIVQGAKITATYRTTPRQTSECGDCVNPPAWLAKSAVADSYFPTEPRCGAACAETAHSSKDVRKAAK